MFKCAKSLANIADFYKKFTDFLNIGKEKYRNR